MSAARDHFEALYAGSADPWGVAGTWYERRKAAILLAMLPRERYALAFEPACGIGVLSRALAPRCDRLLAADFSEHAVAAARARLAGASGVQVRVLDLPREWPSDPFELVVVSEFAYYLDGAGLAGMLAALRAVRGTADIACCHYRGDFDDRATSPHALSQAFCAALGAPGARYAEPLFEVQVWAAQGAAAARSASVIGVAIPAHDEERHLPACLRALAAAARHPALHGEDVVAAVALDDCTDATAAVCEAYGVQALHLRARNVGAARALAAEWLLARGARWICCTDADTVVSPRWIAEQLALRSDAVCGTVGVRGWQARGALADLSRAAFRRNYRDVDGHRHVHGANLGVCARAYEAAGGFQPLACSEDVALVDALSRCGASVAWSARPRVFTSARADPRARGGFGDTLTALATMQRADAG